MSIKTFNNKIGIKTSKKDIASIRRELAYLVDERLGKLIDRNQRLSSYASFNQKVRAYQDVIHQNQRNYFHAKGKEVIEFVAKSNNNVTVSDRLTHQIYEIVAKHGNQIKDELWILFERMIIESIKMNQIDNTYKPCIELKRILIAGQHKHLGRYDDVNFVSRIGNVWGTYDKKVLNESFSKSKIEYGMSIEHDVVGNTSYFIGTEVSDADFLNIENYSKSHMKNKEPFIVFTHANVKRDEITSEMIEMHKKIKKWFSLSTFKRNFEGSMIESFDEKSKVFKIYIPIIYKINGRKGEV